MFVLPFPPGSNTAFEGGAIFAYAGDPTRLTRPGEEAAGPPPQDATVKLGDLRRYLQTLPTSEAWGDDVLHRPIITNALQFMFGDFPQRALIRFSTIQGNKAKSGSGGLHLASESFALLGIKLRNNTAGQTAGGVRIENANALFYSSVIEGNVAESHGAAMYVAGTESVVQILAATNLSRNEARSPGRGSVFYSEGDVTFGLRSRIDSAENVTIAKDGIYSEGNLWYLSATPFGHYIESPFTCSASGPHGCDFSTYGASPMVLYQQGGHALPFPALCRAGYVGSDASELTEATCNGPCPISHYCPAGTVSPLKCPFGEFTMTTGNSESGNCRSCNTGSYYVEELVEATGSVTCYACPTNFTTPDDKGGSGNASCVCQKEFYEHGSKCIGCPNGGNCTQLGVKLESMVVEPHYWRPSIHSLPGPCPYKSTCEGGSVTSLEYNDSSSETCKAGLRGAFCTMCVYDDQVFDPRTEICTPRQGSTDFLAFVIAVLLLIAILPFCSEGWVAQKLDLESRFKCFQTDRTQRGWHNLRWLKNKIQRAMKKIADPVKLCISFYQVIMQMGTVYRTQVPPAYQDLLSFANRIVDWVRLARCWTALCLGPLSHAICPTPTLTDPPRPPSTPALSDSCLTSICHSRPRSPRSSSASLWSSQCSHCFSSCGRSCGSATCGSARSAIRASMTWGRGIRTRSNHPRSITTSSTLTNLASWRCRATRSSWGARILRATRPCCGWRPRTPSSALCR
jgi:hypothetical protein